MGISALACASGAAVLVASVATPASAERRSSATRQVAQARAFLVEIGRYKQTTWHWERVMGARRTPTAATAARSTDLRYRRWVRNLWRRRAALARRRALGVPHRLQWQCIHGHEGAWSANTGNGYYGGLQMSLSFQRAYGGYLLRFKGTADRWTPVEQMWVAERAHRSGRGFYPWPHTARYCGLI